MSIESSRLHPWHGLEVGPEPPRIVTAYIEITPRDVVKYELDKSSGLLKVDRVQQSSSSPPTLYGMIPRTYCGERVAELSAGADRADGDPLDICVFSERPIDKADIILQARVIGGLRMLDNGEADDKIIAVLANDPYWADANDLSDLPTNTVDRLDHYFRTYKLRRSVRPSGQHRIEVRTRRRICSGQRSHRRLHRQLLATHNSLNQSMTLPVQKRKPPMRATGLARGHPADSRHSVGHSFLLNA